MFSSCFHEQVRVGVVRQELRCGLLVFVAKVFKQLAELRELVPFGFAFGEPPLEQGVTDFAAASESNLFQVSLWCRLQVVGSKDHVVVESPQLVVSQK